MVSGLSVARVKCGLRCEGPREVVRYRGVGTGSPGDQMPGCSCPELDGPGRYVSEQILLWVCRARVDAVDVDRDRVHCAVMYSQVAFLRQARRVG